MSTTTRLWLTRVHFRVLVFGTKQSETSISRYVSAPRLFSDICTSYCACVNSTSGILVFSLTTRSRMISYDVWAFDGFSLKAGPKCTNVFVSNEKALVWTSSHCGIVEKAAWERSFWCICQQKGRFFKVHSFVWKQPEVQIKQRELSLLLYSHFISVTHT